MDTLKTLQITVQYLFFLVSLTCLSASCIRGYKNIYAKENYCTQNSLDFKKLDHQTKLFSVLLIKFASPLKMIITHSEYSEIHPKHFFPSIIQYC